MGRLGQRLAISLVGDKILIQWMLAVGETLPRIKSLVQDTLVMKRMGGDLVLVRARRLRNASRAHIYPAGQRRSQGEEVRLAMWDKVIVVASRRPDRFVVSPGVLLENRSGRPKKTKNEDNVKTATKQLTT